MKLTTPRMELLGATIGAKALQFSQKQLNLPIVGLNLWLDTQCVIHQLRGAEKPTTLANTSTASFDPTRGCSWEQLKQHTMWWHGPDWLQNTESEMPSELTYITGEVNMAEKLHWPFASMTLSVQSRTARLPVVDLLRYSTWYKLVRVKPFMNQNKF
uniref:Uncharacterized protein n=1 Tax=Ditylenchus dipsaci TaxID=166011 RepID=A0A915CZA2_9BILA